MGEKAEDPRVHKVEIPIGFFSFARRNISTTWVIPVVALMALGALIMGVYAVMSMEILANLSLEFLGESPSFLRAPESNPIDLGLLLTILPLIITAYYYLITNAQNINIDDHRKAILLSWLQGIGSSILILGLLSQISVSLFSEFKGARAVDSIAGELGRNPETSVQEAIDIYHSYPFLWRAVMASLSVETFVYLLSVVALAVVLGSVFSTLQLTEGGEALVQDGLQRRRLENSREIKRLSRVRSGILLQRVMHFMENNELQWRNPSGEVSKAALKTNHIRNKLRLAHAALLGLYALINLAAWIPLLVASKASGVIVVLSLYSSLIGAIAINAMATIAGDLGMRGVGLVQLVLALFFQGVMVITFLISDMAIAWKIYILVAVLFSYVIAYLSIWGRRIRSRLDSESTSVVRFELQREKCSLARSKHEMAAKVTPASAEEDDLGYFYFAELEVSVPESKKRLDFVTLDEIHALKSIFRTLRSTARAEIKLEKRAMETGSSGASEGEPT